MLKKVRIFDLQVGMYVVDTGLSWIDHPYLYAQEGLVGTEEDIRRIRSDGFAEAFIETDKTRHGDSVVRVYDRGDVDRAMAEALRDFAATRTNKNVPLGEELAAAREAHGRTVETLRQAMASAASGTPLAAQDCLDAAREVAASVSRNRDALVCVSMIAESGGYQVLHGAGVSVLAAAFGDYLGLDRKQVAELAVAGLLHDVGKALTPRELLDKPDKLTEEEYGRVKRHPIESCSVLSASMAMPQHLLRAIAEHHERHDGSGYPRGIKGAEQSFYGRILALADVFDALTQDRPYKARILPDKAMSVLFALRGKEFETTLLERFIKCLGVYPCGSLVRLSNGDHAVVSESNPHSPLRPKVTVVFDKEFQPIHPAVIDLSGKEGPAPARPTEIEALVDHRPHGIKAGEHLI